MLREVVLASHSLHLVICLHVFFHNKNVVELNGDMSFGKFFQSMNPVGFVSYGEVGEISHLLQSIYKIM